MDERNIPENSNEVDRFYGGLLDTLQLCLILLQDASPIHRERLAIIAEIVKERYRAQAQKES